ncbi:NADH-quinone oxidoreductase subunit C [Robertmurraya korlensis]|uniref:NADH-quinone oxidoreductase subunit C n=1 Tax=Robertmurraya korlensis TaxID=519977 RepID=UPI00203EF40D|nr:NADH-quinone oxidoreductase subunit C [Robertmurraya korlensis]MCM3602109.1 NADH-quinone oxidoreductase subunit C [Robertmurraya korlensis]
MSGEKDLEQLKKEAAEKAKAAALAKMKAKEASTEASNDKPMTDEEKAKAKAAAAAKAKAAALAKMKEKEKAEEESSSSEDTDLAKQKAAAAAKAKAAALAKQQGGAEGSLAGDDEKAKAIAAAKAKAAAAAKAKAAALAKQQAGAEGAPAGDDEKAKAIAAAKAKAAAAAKAKAAAQGGAAGDDEKAKAIAAAKAKAAAAAAARAKAKPAEDEAPEELVPSPNQPYLDKYVKVIEEHLGKDVLEDFYINNLSKDVPTLVAKPDTYYKIAEFLRYNEQLGFNYLSEFHGGDFETHMEVYAHLYSYNNRQSVALKVKIDREKPEVESLSKLWAGANWPECETYDLLGIQFKNHPNLYRIMLGDDWIGHPLRKDYEPYDVEV